MGADIKNKRIVIFNGTLMQGGAERVISILSSRMKQEGYTVEILLYYDRELFYSLAPDVKVSSVEGKTKSKNILKNLVFIRKYFRKNADIVLSFLAPFNMVALVAHLGLSLPIIVADRNDPRYIPSKFLMRKLRDFLYRFADGVVFQTTHNRDYFPQSVKKKSTVIANPVDLKELSGTALLARKEKTIVSVGRIMEQKNQEMLIRAFATIQKKFPEYKLVIYGDDSNIRHKQKLEEIISQNELNNKVFLRGNQKDVIKKILSSELFVLSSNYEGMPNALIEAMCVGLPCISTNVSGATDVIQSGYNGEIVNVNDEKAITAAIIKLLSSSELRDLYAKNAIELNEKLETHKIMQQWINYIESIVGEK